jgi:xanthine dehydrogenase accessory factor
MNFDLLVNILNDLRASGVRAAMATIVNVRGSSPGKLGARLVVAEDGRTWGTVGGGCVEADVWQAARTVLQTGLPKQMKVAMTDADAAAAGHLCGGTCEVFIEPLLSEPVWIFGGGHLARALAPMLGTIGMHVNIVEDRAEFAEAAGFPEGTQFHTGPYESLLPALNVPTSAFVVIVTRGHDNDAVVLEWALPRSPWRYIGMVGSRRKARILREHLAAKLPVDVDGDPLGWKALFTPIGIDIGARTPEEIALAIASQIVSVRNGGAVKGNRAPLVQKHGKPVVEEASGSEVLANGIEVE